MANFVNFVADAANNPDMGKEFVTTIKDMTAETLSAWFKDKEYDVPIDECQKLIDSKDNISDMKSISSERRY
jgi:hypothetical protein